jgi:hypothetical protein
MERYNVNETAFEGLHIQTLHYMLVKLVFMIHFFNLSGSMFPRLAPGR